MKATCLLLATVLIAAGCAVQKTVTITSAPPDAQIKVNSADRGTSPVIEKFVFKQPTDVFYVTASRKGFQDKTVPVTQDGVIDSLNIDLKPYARRITMLVQPVPAIISIDGRPLTAEPVSSFTADVEFRVDKNENWMPHTLVAERSGFIKAEAQVSYADGTGFYNLKLEAMRKDVKINTEPAGAEAYIDGEKIGTTPVTIRQRAFEYDVGAGGGAGKWVEHTLKVTKPGYDPIEVPLSWDNGQTDYSVPLLPKRKAVRLTTEPAGATVKIDGVDVRMNNGVATADLVFTPVNATGELKTFKARITKSSPEAEFYPQDLVIKWDEGKAEYPIKLREILSQQTPATELAMAYENDQWSLKAKGQQTVSMKFVTEPDGEQPTKVVDAGKGQTVGSLSVSPDGQYLVYTAVSQTPSGPRSQMFRVRSDGTGGATGLSDGRSIDATPAYTAAGDKIFYSSNRTGRKFSIWGINSDGTGGVSRYTASDTNDLSPSVDASAKPRLFYQAHDDGRPDPKLFSVEVKASLQTDLTGQGGFEPKISPRNDSVVYTLPNEKTAKRDIYRVSDKGGLPESLTSGDDNINPSWDAAGTRIAFASDRGQESEDKRHNYDIWVMDAAGGTPPKQITRNGSVDDLPVFDPAGDAIYFRSNRGGSWAVWKIAVK